MLDFESVSAHIFRLELAYKILGPFSIPVSVWLVRNEEDWILIDSGPPESADKLISALTRATRGRGVRRVFLTHAHIDHSGGLTALRMAWNPALVCHWEEVPFVTGEMKYRHLKPRSMAFWFGRFFLRRAGSGLPVSRDLERGEAADGMAVIHLPGHTPGQIGFLHPEDGAMICGDAVVNLRGRLTAPFASSTADPESAYASMERLAELDYRHLLPSHGPPILKHGNEAMLELIEHHEQEEMPAEW